MSVRNVLATTVGSGSAQSPEAALISAALQQAMKWEEVERTVFHGAHWRLLDPIGRIVAVIDGEDNIFSPVYEDLIPLGQYTTLEGAKWIVEQWQAKRMEMDRTGTYDPFKQAASVVQFYENKKAVDKKDNPEGEDKG